jgi:hypothetical protein
MSWRTEISLRNNRNDDILCVIPKGSVFENKNVGSMVQNVAVSREYRLIIPGGGRLTVEVEVNCINKSFSPPSGRGGNITIFKIDQPFSSQEELWRIMQTPRV